MSHYWRRSTWLPALLTLLFGSILALCFPQSSLAGPRSLSGSKTFATVWSENRHFYLKTLPYDAHEPPKFGRTTVFSAEGVERYSFEHAFLASDTHPLFLSNDGELILAVLVGGHDDSAETKRSVTVYRKGRLIRSYTRAESSTCGPREWSCWVKHSDRDYIDQEKSQWGTRAYRRVLREDLSEEERFLANLAAFSVDNLVYLTDSHKQTKVFSLLNGELISSLPFSELSPTLRARARANRIQSSRKAAGPHELPKLADGSDAIEALARRFNMRRLTQWWTSDFQVHQFHLEGLLTSSGVLDVKELVTHSDRLDRQAILDFIASSRFETRQVDTTTGIYYVLEAAVGLRDFDDDIARREKRDATAAREEVLKSNAARDHIDGAYIPKDLEDCFKELDKLLPADDREALRKDTADPIHLHLGLGMYVRNRWGLWANSRLANYFRERGVAHPDSMSGVILSKYRLWLKGRTEASSDWHQNR